VSVTLAYRIAFVVVAALWLVFLIRFVFGRSLKREAATRKSRVSILGIVIQGLGYLAVSMLQRRPFFSPIVPLPGALAYLPPLLAIALSGAGIWLSLTAVRTLGREWSYEARLVEGHRLVTTGPYRWVRHPIYTAMIAKLIAIGIVLSHWIGLLAGVVLITIGTLIRTRSEEKLLREQFGAEYDAYARRVPGLVPIRFGAGT